MFDGNYSHPCKTPYSGFYGLTRAFGVNIPLVPCSLQTLIAGPLYYGLLVTAYCTVHWQTKGCEEETLFKNPGLLLNPVLILEPVVLTDFAAPLHLA
jgi:hypothetical protein